MNSTIKKMLSAINQIIGVKNGGRRQTRKLGHEPTPQKKVRRKNIKIESDQKTLVERKSKKRRKIAANSRKINRLRGVGI